jgi:hypothetical protein
LVSDHFLHFHILSLLHSGAGASGDMCGGSPLNRVFIIADLQDYEIAVELAADSIGRASDELSPHARDVLALIQSAKLKTFTMDDLQTRQPDWTRYRFRAGLDELLNQEVLTSTKCGRGTVRQYELQPGAAALLAAANVVLLSAGEVGELAKVGEAHFANFTPGAAIG